MKKNNINKIGVIYLVHYIYINKNHRIKYLTKLSQKTDDVSEL
ncbi:hypothetical protein Q7O_002031 [Pectobacterium carotovorum subsp. carotovorum PCCS1]|nr:hypothetical protein [Pectobacterium carotovorum subsp. carotovorum PCCS1]